MVAFLESFMPTLPLPVTLDLHVSVRVLGFALGLALTTAVTFGLAPAFRSTRVDLAAALHGQHSTPDRRRLRLRHVLVGAQVALSLVLLVTTGLFLRALQHAAGAETGYDGARVRVFTLNTSLAGHVNQRAVTLADRLLDRIGRIDGVEAVATSRMIPLQGGRLGLGALRVPGYASPRGNEVFDADWDVISPGFFATLRVPVISGRAFTNEDHEGRPFVAVVNESFAARAWPGREPIGQVVYQATARDRFDRPVTIVGVARNARYRTAGEAPAPFIYVPLAQQPMTEMNIYVREAPARQVSVDVARVIAEVAPSLPIITSQTFEDAAGIGLLPQRLAAWIGGGVGSVGLLLTALGLYGLMAFHAGQRTREVALRMALGATPAQVRTLLMRQGGSVGVIGAVVGMGLAGGAGIGMQRLLVGVQPFDGMAFGAATGLLGAVLVSAVWLPARRAAAVDPAAALRAE
jgi:predicted permease